MRLRLIGDIHGDPRPVIKNYARTDYDQLIQLGDFGFRDTYEKYLNMWEPEKLRILAGNHDDYDAIPDYQEYFLGDYGLLPGTDGKVFYVRGAWSIDQHMRIPGVSWWQNEELNWKQVNDCLDLYNQVKDGVEVILSHDAPISVAASLLKQYPFETVTGKLLFELLRIKAPERWRFAHHHVCWQKQMGRTHFRCLNINEGETIEV